MVMISAATCLIYFNYECPLPLAFAFLSMHIADIV